MKIRADLSNDHSLEVNTQDHSRGKFLLVGTNADIAARIEADRRHLAEEIQESIIEPLNMLLAQANTFEQTLPGQPAVRMAISVLSSLARQVVQRAYDLESNLRPAVLETLGLRPALEVLSNQYERAYNLRLVYQIAPLPHQLSSELELELFRIIQDVMEALRNQRISQVSLDLKETDGFIWLGIFFPISAFVTDQHLRTICQRAELLGGNIGSGMVQGQSSLTIHIPIFNQPNFTKQELVILEALTHGLSNKQIAVQLSISPRTVNYHLDHIFSKLGVRTRTEAAAIALRQDLVQKKDQATKLANHPV